MSGISKKLMGTTAAGGGGFTAIEDVFSTYLITGTEATQTVTNGIDLAGEGGLVWLKSRTSAIIPNHYLADSTRTITNSLSTNTTAAATSGSGLTQTFNSDGFSAYLFNETYASWTFRKAPRFFDVVTYTGTGSAQTIAHNLGTTVGSIIIKRTDGVEAWYMYHRSVGATKYIRFDSTSTPVTSSSWWGNTDPTDAVFSLGGASEVNASGGSFVAYVFAHDPLGLSGDGSDGLIACGTVTLPSRVTLGWEPQWLMAISTSDAGDRYIYDNMRGWPAGNSASVLSANTSAAEAARSEFQPDATGFLAPDGGSSSYIYIAIRRGPMRAPESGTEVFNTIVRNGTGAAATVTGVGFAPELVIAKNRAEPVTAVFYDKLRGVGRVLASSFTSAELIEATSDGITSFNNDGVSLREDNDQYGGINNSIGASYANYLFRRAPNFFDVVAYTGDGTNNRDIPHNLGATPEMFIVKRRNLGEDWLVYHSATGPENVLVLNQTYGALDRQYFADTAPTSTHFTVGNLPSVNPVNGSGSTYIAYLFATLDGISKVGSYTGNGSSQTIDCGFTTGARFIIIKRTDGGESGTGGWYVWDTARGIVTGNDPHLRLNNTEAEITTDDSIDPDSSGFIVNQVAATNINVSAASYIFYAVA